MILYDRFERGYSQKAILTLWPLDHDLRSGPLRI